MDTNNLERFLAASGMGVRARRMTFEGLKQDEKNRLAIKTSKEFVDGVLQGKSPEGICLFGTTGTGKTHIACAMANAILAGGILVRFLPTVRIPREDQDEVLRLGDPDEFPVLILDDLGAEKPTARLLECVFAIIDERLRQDAPLVCTTNFTEKALREKFNAAGDSYGDRIVGRLREACVWIPVGGKDRRLEM